MPGPTVTMTPAEMPSRAAALGSCSFGSRRGVIAWRVAEAIVAATALTVVMT